MKFFFAVKQKTFFLVSKVLSFGHKKENSKNIPDIILKGTVITGRNCLIWPGLML